MVLQDLGIVKGLGQVAVEVGRVGADGGPVWRRAVIANEDKLFHEVRNSFIERLERFKIKCVTFVFFVIADKELHSKVLVLDSAGVIQES
jgi:hypothetical protein